MPVFPKIPAHPRDPLLLPTLNYFEEHGEALHNAAMLIAGAAAGRRVVALLSELQQASRLTRSVTRRLHELHQLISLEVLPHDDSELIDCSLYLDPQSAEVGEICLLADSLGSLLQNIEEHRVGTPATTYDRRAA